MRAAMGPSPVTFCGCSTLSPSPMTKKGACSGGVGRGPDGLKSVFPSACKQATPDQARRMRTSFISFKAVPRGYAHILSGPPTVYLSSLFLSHILAS